MHILCFPENELIALGGRWEGSGKALGGRWRVTGGEGWVWESDL